MRADAACSMMVGMDRDLTEGYGGPPDPTILFTPQEVAAELPSLRAERVRRPVASPDGEVEAIDALVRARRTNQTRRDA